MKERKPLLEALLQQEAKERKEKQEDGQGDCSEELEKLLVDTFFDAFKNAFTDDDTQSSSSREQKVILNNNRMPEGFRVLSSEERLAIAPEALELLQELHLLGLLDAETEEEILEYALESSSKVVGLLEIKQAIALVLSVKMPKQLYAGISSFLTHTNHKLN